MKYYLDCEFNGFGGELISLGIVREDGKELYAALYGCNSPYEEWVAENVIPIIGDAVYCDKATLAVRLQAYFAGDNDIVVISDWWDDIKYLCESVITGPGKCINVSGMKFEVARVDAYPTTLEGAIQHNALWDALALKHFFDLAASGVPA